MRNNKELIYLWLFTHTFFRRSTEILYFRIQDHLRCIGLGRLALGKLVDKLADDLTEKFKKSGISKAKLKSFNSSRQEKVQNMVKKENPSLSF